MHIRPFQPGDEQAAVNLWRRCDLIRPWNDPHKDIARKRRVRPDLFLVGTIDNKVVATVMAGYEGHRGWLNYLAVARVAQIKRKANRVGRAVPSAPISHNFMMFVGENGALGTARYLHRFGQHFTARCCAGDKSSGTSGISSSDAASGRW